MKAKVTKVLKQYRTASVVEMTITVQTTIMEGRHMPSMSYKDSDNRTKIVDDEQLIIAAHEALDDDEIAQAEMARICD